MQGLHTRGIPVQDSGYLTSVPQDVPWPEVHVENTGFVFPRLGRNSRTVSKMRSDSVCPAFLSGHWSERKKRPRDSLNKFDGREYQIGEFAVTASCSEVS